MFKINRLAICLVLILSVSLAGVTMAMAMGMGRQGQAPAGTWTRSSTMGNMGTMGNDNMPHSNMGYGNMTH
jgi:hypothetical protein